MAATHAQSFLDRADAGSQLARALRIYRGQHPLVLAIPRGGVPIGRAVVDALGGELDVVLVRKLGAPGNPELAIGAIDEQGRVSTNEYAAVAGADETYVQAEAAEQLELIRARRARYRPQGASIDPTGRLVIVVDDGLATGATMHAALAAVRARKPARLVCAVPVAAPRSLAELDGQADDVVCLVAPPGFHAVGQFYHRFPAVSDEEVIRLLASAPKASGESTVQSVRLPVDGVMLATLLFDLLSPMEDNDRRMRFDVSLLAARLGQAVTWARGVPALHALPIGLFGASTGAAAALMVAAEQPGDVAAVVSRGGRPDLAGAVALAQVTAPTLLIVGGADTDVITLNRQALAQMNGVTELVLVPRATHLFEEPGALERVAALASGWFKRWLGA